MLTDKRAALERGIKKFACHEGQVQRDKQGENPASIRIRIALPTRRRKGVARLEARRQCEGLFEVLFCGR
jgi:hypothetical protein